MNASRSARERVRAELTREIREEARRQLAADGAQRLSVRAVARELGMVSSAVYRYFPSRDSLLTALIIDAYEALGGGAEAGQPRSDLRARWRAACHAVRNWAVAHPHEYALIYGSPVPGYHAPPETITPASRVGIVLGRLLADAWADDAAGEVPGGRLTPLLAKQADALAAVIAPGVPGPLILRGMVAWTQLFGMISFELFGQLVGTVEPADDFFRDTVEQMADFAGIR
jgi:AcrR family transcriptional regulator